MIPLDVLWHDDVLKRSSIGEGMYYQRRIRHNVLKDKYFSLSQQGQLHTYAHFRLISTVSYQEVHRHASVPLKVQGHCTTLLLHSCPCVACALSIICIPATHVVFCFSFSKPRLAQWPSPPAPSNPAVAPPTPSTSTTAPAGPTTTCTTTSTTASIISCNLPLLPPSLSFFPHPSTPNPTI